MSKRNLAGFSADTEVLTRTQGWVTFDHLTYMDEVATRSPDGRFEWQHPERITVERYDGPMLHFRSQVFDLMVMPEHPLPVMRRGQRGQPDETIPNFRPASWFSKRSRGQWYRMPTTSAWKGCAPQRIIVPAAERKRGRHHPAPALEIAPTTWMRLLGWFLSEGSVASAQYLQNVVMISQTRELHKPDIRRTLDGLGHRWRENASGFELNHGPLAHLLRTTCYAPGIRHAHNKRVPDSVKEYPADLLAEMFDSMMRGDGHVEVTGLRRYLTTSRTLANDTVEILQKMGTQGWYHTIAPPPPGSTVFRGQVIGKRHVQYRVTERPGNASATPLAAEVAYLGTVHRASTQNRTIYVRRNGRTGWCGA